MIAITEHPAGCVLPVRATPRARKPGVGGEQGGALKVAVSAPPEDGRANEAIVEALAKALGVKRNQIELMSGATHREKRFLIRGLSVAEMQQRLAVIQCPG